MKRVTVVNSELKEKLSSKQQILSLILIVTFPYLKNKLAQLSSRYKLQEVDGCTSREASSKILPLFKKIYCCNNLLILNIIDTEETKVLP